MFLNQNYYGQFQLRNNWNVDRGWLNVRYSREKDFILASLYWIPWRTIKILTKLNFALCIFCCNRVFKNIILVCILLILSICF